MRWARVSPLLLAGCFGDPPSVETGETGSSITTAVESSEASTSTSTGPTSEASISSTTLDQGGRSTNLCIVAGGAAPSCTAGEVLPLVPTDELLAIGGPTSAAEIDEVRISRVAPPEAWLRVQQRSIAPDFATFDEPTPQ